MHSFKHFKKYMSFIPVSTNSYITLHNIMLRNITLTSWMVLTLKIELYGYRGDKIKQEANLPIWNMSRVRPSLPFIYSRIEIFRKS